MSMELSASLRQQSERAMIAAAMVVHDAMRTGVQLAAKRKLEIDETAYDRNGEPKKGRGAPGISRRKRCTYGPPDGSPIGKDIIERRDNPGSAFFEAKWRRSYRVPFVVYEVACQHSPSSYRHSPSSYRHSPSSYRHSPSAYRHSPSSYRHSSSSYRHSPSSYRHSPSSYHHSPSSYRHSPSAYRSSPRAYRSSPRSSRHSPSPYRRSTRRLSTSFPAGDQDRPGAFGTLEKSYQG